jgi:hypothetical protein
MLEAELFNDFMANPQRLGNFIPPNFRDWVIIDEIQRVPELLFEIHRLIETRKIFDPGRPDDRPSPSCFTRRAKRRLVVHPKFYFFDVGLYRTIRPRGPLEALEEVEGVALETLFLQEILALNRALDLGYRVFFWRTANGREVDFVLYGPKGLLAFEIKTTSRGGNKGAPPGKRCGFP